jgi:hypothetical protein
MKYNSVLRLAEVGGIILAFITVILGLALSGTIVTQSDNARAEAALDNNITRPHTGDSTLGHAMTGAPGVFALLPLMWAALILAIMAVVVIRQF